VTFPTIWHLGAFSMAAHTVMEALGYAVGARLFFLLKKRFPNPGLDFEQQISIVVACLAGALLGAKLLAFVESFHAYWPLRNEPAAWIGGKTIVGGLAGGWAGVEFLKRRLHITQSTGDRFVFPILVGLCIGRIGCFLEGLPDHTYGIPTQLPWGVDFGDGIPRHPTQLYEIAFCLLLGIALLMRMRRPWPKG